MGSQVTQMVVSNQMDQVVPEGRNERNHSTDIGDMISDTSSDIAEKAIGTYTDIARQRKVDNAKQKQAEIQKKYGGKRVGKGIQESSKKLEKNKKAREDIQAKYKHQRSK